MPEGTDSLCSYGDTFALLKQFARNGLFWYTQGRMKKPGLETRPRLALAALITAYVGLSIASSFATRMPRGPDEPAHFIYVRSIGSHLALPILSHQETGSTDDWSDERYERRQPLRASHEAHQPPLYYILAAVPYYIASSLGADTDTSWRVLRIFTVLFGAGWIYFLYRLSREFLGGRRYSAVLSAACVGLLPSAVYIGGVVNNDMLGCLLFTAALWLIFKSVRRGEINWRSAVEMGVVMGLAVLTKAQGIFLLPVVAVAALVIGRRKGWSQSGPTLANGAAALLAAMLVSSPWFIRNWHVYGSPMIQSLYNPWTSSLYGLGLEGWTAAVNLVTGELFKYFWTPFWLVKYSVDDGLYAGSLLAVCLVIAAGAVAHLLLHRKSRTGDLTSRADAWGLLALPVLLIYIFLFRHTLVVDRGALQQGRLLLPAAGLLGVSTVAGLGSFFRRPSIRTALGILLVIALLAANIAVLRSIVEFYRVVEPY